MYNRLRRNDTMKTFFACLMMTLCLYAIANAEKVTRNVTIEGNEFTVTVDSGKRPIDSRIFDFIEKEKRDVNVLAAETTERPVNLSGYRMTINATAFVACRSVLQFIQRIPAILDPDTIFTIDGSFSEYMDGTFFPLSGNVNVFLKTQQGNKAPRRCQKSGKPTQRLDVVGCYFPGCFNQDFITFIEVFNPSSANEAVFVGSASVLFINP